MSKSTMSVRSQVEGTVAPKCDVNFLIDRIEESDMDNLVKGLIIALLRTYGKQL